MTRAAALLRPIEELGPLDVPLTPVPAPVPKREVIARAIYRQRPFRTARSGAVMDGFLTCTHEFDFAGAPDFYRSECYELADGIILDLALAEQGELR